MIADALCVLADGLKFPDHFVWQTYGEVDTRRKNLDSAIQNLVDSGDALVVDVLETVALWSLTIPGGWHSFSVVLIVDVCGCEGDSGDPTSYGTI